MTRTILPHPTCCDAAKRLIALRHAYDTIYAEHRCDAAAIASYRATAPRWTIVARTPAQLEEVATVIVCPFCAAALPGIRLRAKPPRRIRTVTDGGYYCATCERRLQECRCAPAERLWEATR